MATHLSETDLEKWANEIFTIAEQITLRSDVPIDLQISLIDAAQNAGKLLYIMGVERGNFPSDEDDSENNDPYEKDYKYKHGNETYTGSYSGASGDKDKSEYDYYKGDNDDKRYAKSWSWGSKDDDKSSSSDNTPRKDKRRNSSSRMIDITARREKVETDIVERAEALTKKLKANPRYQSGEFQCISDYDKCRAQRGSKSVLCALVSLCLCRPKTYSICEVTSGCSCSLRLSGRARMRPFEINGSAVNMKL